MKQSSTNNTQFAAALMANMLENGVINVMFTKKDGQLRKMRCTRNLNIIPKGSHPKTSIKPITNNIAQVFDLDINEWRSFGLDQIKSIIRE